MVLCLAHHYQNIFRKKKISDISRRTQDEIENSNIWELIMTNLPEHWEDAVDAARNLQSYAVNERDNEVVERKARKDRERAQRDAQREAERNQDFSINVLEGDNLESVPKKNQNQSRHFHRRERLDTTQSCGQRGKGIRKIQTRDFY